MAIDIEKESLLLLEIGFAAVLFLLVNLIIAPTTKSFIFSVSFAIIVISTAGFFILLRTIKKVMQ